jgi:hypothetical protein
MGIVNYPNGLASFGMPVLGGGFTLPTMGRLGKVFFVDPARGSDGNRGTSMERPFATVSKAYSLTTDKAGDVIYLLNDGNTSGTSRDAATITWANDNTHLVGLGAPTLLSQRARISPPTAATAIVTPQLKITGHGNVFANFSLFEGTSEDSIASVGIEIETGTRNYFWNVAIMNMGDATNGHSGDEANSAHLLLDGASENTFDSCYIGMDTAARTAANASVRFRKNGSTTSARNVFRNCVFPMFADADAPLFIDANESGCVDRWNMFDHCTFTNAVGSTATAQTAASVIHSSAGGLFLMKDCMLVGATDWHASDTTNMKLVGHAWSTDDVTIGIAADVDVTA